MRESRTQPAVTRTRRRAPVRVLSMAMADARGSTDRMFSGTPPLPRLRRYFRFRGSKPRQDGGDYGSTVPQVKRERDREREAARERGRRHSGASQARCPVRDMATDRSVAAAASTSPRNLRSCPALAHGGTAVAAALLTAAATTASD